ncbi:hypothetical protein C9994_07125 [Marivirga lumbricoides]|uniref:Uncharacterized protein n=1 Tax=Marivirga lumbricoides TaxID=1046115 RepID=A0A2T4DRT8_9BACT|nr:hypothetical protein C9994_07125 [Marivirga lumbricoides]
MTLIKTRFALIISLILILLFSCEKEETKKLPTDILSFWDFKGYEISGTLEEIPDSISIDLYIGSVYSEGNDFDGETPFRNYWGRFRLDEENIDFYDLRVTDVLTQEDSLLYYKIEEKYLLSLMKAKNYTVKNNVLSIYIGEDSCLLFTKSENTIYQDDYEFHTQFNEYDWTAISNSIGISLDYNYSSQLHTYRISAESEDDSFDGYRYNLDISIYYPPKKGQYIVNNEDSMFHIPGVYATCCWNSVSYDCAYSINGYMNIIRVSRGFISGEFGIDLVHSQGFEIESEIGLHNGSFKIPIRSSSGGKPLYKTYNSN